MKVVNKSFVEVVLKKIVAEKKFIKTYGKHKVLNYLGNKKGFTYQEAFIDMILYVFDFLVEDEDEKCFDSLENLLDEIDKYMYCEELHEYVVAMIDSHDNLLASVPVFHNDIQEAIQSVGDSGSTDENIEEGQFLAYEHLFYGSVNYFIDRCRNKDSI